MMVIEGNVMPAAYENMRAYAITWQDHGAYNGGPWIFAVMLLLLIYNDGNVSKPAPRSSMRMRDCMVMYKVGIRQYKCNTRSPNIIE